MNGRVPVFVTALIVVMLSAVGSAAAAPINHYYFGVIDGGGTVDVLVSNDETEVNIFSALNFGGAGCESTMGVEDIPLSDGSFSFFSSTPTRSVTGFLGFGTATGTVRLSAVCDTGTRSWSAEIPVDALISDRTGAATIGDGIYSPSGKGQTKSAKARRGKTKAWKFGIERHPEANEAAPYHAKGCASNDKFKVRYLSGGENVTPDVTSGDFTQLLTPGQIEELRVEMTAKRKAKHGSSRTCRLQAIYNAGEAVDVAAVKLTVR